MADREKRKKRWWRTRDAAADAAGSGGEAALGGCGCDISLLIALTLVAGVPLLLWSL
jgi:hypothetical protein